MMRKLNIIVIVGILLTVLCHILIGSFMLLGADNTIPKVLSRTALTLTGIHAVISSVLTVKTLRIRKKAGAGYFKENLMFWARRISGFAIIIPLVMHGGSDIPYDQMQEAVRCGMSKFNIATEYQRCFYRASRSYFAEDARPDNYFGYLRAIERPAVDLVKAKIAMLNPDGFSL